MAVPPPAKPVQPRPVLRTRACVRAYVRAPDAAAGLRLRAPRWRTTRTTRVSMRRRRLPPSTSTNWARTPRATRFLSRPAPRTARFVPDNSKHLCNVYVCTLNHTHTHTHTHTHAYVRKCYIQTTQTQTKHTQHISSGCTQRTHTTNTHRQQRERERVHRTHKHTHTHMQSHTQSQ